MADLPIIATVQQACIISLIPHTLISYEVSPEWQRVNHHSMIPSPTPLMPSPVGNEVVTTSTAEQYSLEELWQMQNGIRQDRKDFELFDDASTNMSIINDRLKAAWIIDWQLLHNQRQDCVWFPLASNERICQ
eukprot:9511746-Ditylum_brightwellii.AAC.2